MYLDFFKGSVKVLISGVVLSGCVAATNDVFWREGSTFEQRQKDFTSCEVQALAQVPRAMTVGVTPSYVTPTFTTPAHTTCNTIGGYTNCTTTGGNTTGGQVVGGQPYSYDANAELRQRVINLCISQKGYYAASIPTCTKEQAKNAVVIPRFSPKLSTVACMTSDRQGYVPKS